MKRLALILCFSLPSLIFAKEVETLIYNVEVKITANSYGDSHDSTNEYKLDLRLQAKNGLYPGDSGNTLGVLTASHSSNIYKFFGDFERLQIGETATRISKVILPANVMKNTLLKLTLLEDDFTVPVPGPCCININNDDLEVKQFIDLAEGEKNIVFFGESAKVEVTIKLASQKLMNLKDILNEQKAYLYKDSIITLGSTKEANLYRHILEHL